MDALKEVLTQGRKGRAAWRSIIAAVVGIALILFFSRNLDTAGLRETILGASLPWLAISALLGASAYPLRAIRLRLLLGRVRQDARIETALWATGVGNMVNTVIPVRLLGEFAKAYVLDAKDKVGYAQAVSSVAVERILDLLIISFLAFGSIIISPSSSIPPWIVDGLRLASSLVMAAVVVIGFAVTKKGFVLKATRSLLSHTPLAKMVDKAELVVSGMIEGSRGLSLGLRRTPILVGTSALIWLSSFWSAQALFIGVGINADASAVLLGTMAFNLTFIAPAAPGFIGTYEAFFTAIFLGLGVAGFGVVLGSAAIHHILNIAVVLSLGFLSLAKTGLAFGEVAKPTLGKVTKKPT